VTVAVLVPHQPGCHHRDRAWRWIHNLYLMHGCKVVVGSSDVEGFSRTQAILDARSCSDADLFLIADADVRVDGSLPASMLEAAESVGWAVPGLLHRLSEDSTTRVLAGEPWRGLPLSTDNPQDSKPYRIHEAGTLLAVTAEAFDLAPPDPRFVGWGHEDDAWAAALHTLVGPPKRTDTDVVHLWHPPQPRQSRITGNDANKALARRYRNARRSPKVMAALIEEGAAHGTPVPR
jgi:hypothetical protein